MATPQEWSQGYARQAAADFERYLKMEAANTVIDRIESCHKLQFLQMACEKLVKAHLCGSGTPPHSIQSSHAYIANTLPLILRQSASELNLRGKSARVTLKHAKHLAQEIEILAPAVKRGGGRLDNCEYPWEDGNGKLHVPVDWSFTTTNLIDEPAGRVFLKLLHYAINSLAP